MAPKMRVRWANHGPRPPKAGRFLTNAKLSFALQHTEWVLLEDLLDYGVTDLRPGDFVLGGTCYFVALDAEQAPRSPVNRAVNMPVKAAGDIRRWGSSLEKRTSCGVLAQPSLLASAEASSSLHADQGQAADGGWLGWLWSA